MLTRGLLATLFAVVEVYQPVTAADSLSNVSGSVRMNDLAEVGGADVILNDVARVEGDGASALGAVVLATFEQDQESTTITLTTLRAKLDGVGVNWGRVTLGGFASCTVHRKATDAPPIVVASEPAVAVNPVCDVDLNSALTLREKITQDIERLTGADRHDLRITFTDSDERDLASTKPGVRFETQPSSKSGLGRVPIVVRCYDGTTRVRTFNLAPHVERRFLALVAGVNIDRGQPTSPSDAEVREVYTDDVRGTPLTDPNDLVGRVATSSIKAGQLLFSNDAQTPVAIRRGDKLRVRTFVGSLVIAVDARALEDGQVGQVIRVQNAQSRTELAVKVTGSSEAVVADEQVKEQAP